MISVIAEETDYLIVNKPAGILVHPPQVNYQEDTVVSGLKTRYPEIQQVGDDTALRPGIVHRLDAAVSGVMVIARTQAFFEWIKTQFKRRTVKKEYIALVYGSLKKDEGVINLPLKKAPFHSRTKVMPRGSLQAKDAITHFEVLARFWHYTLIRVTIKTGRTHQIRAHFANYGHSLVGDREYCHPRYRNRSAFTKHIKFDRVFLHQERLGFYDRDREWREYQAQLPDDLQSFLETLSLCAQ
jgi:23S rRNA pseudouridine1911/1915/1917 synthase